MNKLKKKKQEARIVHPNHVEVFLKKKAIYVSTVTNNFVVKLQVNREWDA